MKEALKPKKLSRSYLRFANAGQKFAVPIECVCGIFRPSSLFSLPSADPRVRGIWRKDDKLIPVLDLSSLLGPSANPRYLICCHVRGQEMAFEVEAADHVVEIPESTRQMLESTPSANPGTAMITAIAVVNNESISLLNLEGHAD